MDRSGKKGRLALLLSRYALDCATFDRHRSGSGWIGSDLRNWLNESFLRNAFDDGERERIRDMEVVSPGEKDLVFLLSTEEAEKYLKSDRSRRCVPTVYCKTQGAWVEDGRCWWWLRSNGMGGYAAVVRSDGVIDKKGDPVAGSKENTVRPAVWIRLGR